MSDDAFDQEQAGSCIDVPTQLASLPDGRLSLEIGDVPGLASFNHRQGDNPEHFQADCGLVSVEDVLRQFGAQVSEGDVVTHALQRGECSVNPGAAGQSGGTAPSQDARILTDYGVPSRVESGQTLAQLAAQVEHGHGVIIGLNCGILWQVPDDVGVGVVNHAVTVTGVARDPRTGNIQGFYINDSGNGKSGEFVSAVVMRVAWQDTGGWTVVTDCVRPHQAGPSV
jgi:hypothetical protein